MQLRTRKSQTTKGIISKKPLFALDAQIAFTAQERASIDKYQLGEEIVYSSDAKKKHVDTMVAASQGQVGLLKGFAAMAANAFTLSCTINSLARGQHIECKTLGEVLEADLAIKEACQTVRTFLDVAATFDGSQETLEF